MFDMGGEDDFPPFKNVVVGWSVEQNHHGEKGQYCDGLMYLRQSPEHSTGNHQRGDTLGDLRI